MYRFKEDLHYGRLLCHVRDGNCTKEDIIHLNKRLVVSGKTQGGQSIPMHIRYGTFQNRERDAINDGLFHKRCVERWRRFQNLDDSLLIFCCKLKSGMDKESILIPKVLHHSGKTAHQMISS